MSAISFTDWQIRCDAPGAPCAWRTLVTKQCAGHLHRAGFAVEIIGDSIELTDAARPDHNPGKEADR